MLEVESVCRWDIESFVDLCSEVVSFVTTLIEKCPCLSSNPIGQSYSWYCF